MNSGGGFRLGTSPHDLQSGQTSRDVSCWWQQHSNHQLNISASINSVDGFNPVAVLRELQSAEITREGSSRGQEHSNSRFNVSASISSDDGFDPEALLLELQSEETSMDVSNRGQQHSNSRFNASAPINSDVGFVSGALLCRLQSKEMTRGVSKGQHHAPCAAAAAAAAAVAAETTCLPKKSSALPQRLGALRSDVEGASCKGFLKMPIIRNMKKSMENQFLSLFVVMEVLTFISITEQNYASPVGDPGMNKNGLRVAFEGRNFCNEVGYEAPEMGSPRAADCFDLSNNCLMHRVTDEQNKLGVGKSFPGLREEALYNPDLYAIQKELYLGSLCEVDSITNPGQFWMWQKDRGFRADRKVPMLRKGCMNQPKFHHQKTSLVGNEEMRGSFNGFYDLGVGIIDGEKKVGSGSWVFRHKLKTSERYPWLMLYLRADASRGFSGGYHYQTRGMLKTLPESPNFKVKFSLNVKQGRRPKSQFYLLDIGSCWKNNDMPSDGDVLTDVTRYGEMIINPETPSWCSPKILNACPPYHITSKGKMIYRNATDNFPFSAYHYYCSPGNAMPLEAPFSLCDAHSNPQAQELVQILPHPVWAEYGYPSKPGEGWIGDPRTWELAFQDPGTPPAGRVWTSIDVGTEVFISSKSEVTEWILK
ncbi:hypothetical protein ACLOJK_022068 [Asimina triloba]